jgi:hypothetical protein
MIKLILLFFFSAIGFVALTQNAQRKTVLIERTAIVNPTLIEPDFHAEITSLEAPLPDGDSYRSFLMNQKVLAKEHHQNQPKKSENTFQSKTNFEPQIGATFIPKRYTNNGLELLIYGGIPSDNTMAISNDGIALVAMNSLIYGRDLVNDTAVFADYRIFIRSLANGSAGSTYYDPKLYYDPIADRFICAMLKDFDPERSEVVICFSSSSDPNDEWYVYNLPGNPLDNNRWTDFPVITVTNDKLYFTANLIIPDVSWQTGFDGSIIWEMDKQLGYEGAASVNAHLYSDIKYDNKFIRNLHAVQGADGVTEDLILLSNRNFDIENDTIFFLQLKDGNLTIDAIKSDLPYGVPPNARQQDTDTSDPTMGLQTNDARVLGAIRFDDHIQFVSNTMNPATGFSAIYHGTIHNITDVPSISATIIGDNIRDYAYPNIAWSGNEDCDKETIIAFNHSSFTDFPGVSALHYSNEQEYSNVITVKEGLNFVNRLPGGYERWGDYFGLQRKYNEPGKVYSFGYLAMANNNNSGYFAELISPDTSKLTLNLSLAEAVNICNNTVNLNILYGEAPFEIFWTTPNFSGLSSALSMNNLCQGDTVSVTVSDSRGCQESIIFIIPKANLENGVSVFPNPSSDMIAIQFNLDEASLIKVELYDHNGRLVKVIREQHTKEGLNELTFSLNPLAAGQYAVVLYKNEVKLETHKVLKSN